MCQDNHGINRLTEIGECDIRLADSSRRRTAYDNASRHYNLAQFGLALLLIVFSVSVRAQDKPAIDVNQKLAGLR